MHNALGLDLGYGRYRNVGSARKFVFVIGMTALAGVLLLGVTASVVDLPEESEKWSKFLSASAMFCIGLSFLMWCVDELVFTPLALGEWNVRSLIPFRWTRHYETMLRIAQSYDDDLSSNSSLEDENFSRYSSYVMERINNPRTPYQREIVEGNSDPSERLQANTGACDIGKSKTGISTVGETFAALISNKKKNKNTERESLLDGSSGASTSTDSQSAAMLRIQQGEVQQYIADFQNQDARYSKVIEENMKRWKSRYGKGFLQQHATALKPQTALEVGLSSVEVHVTKQTQGVTTI